MNRFQNRTLTMNILLFNLGLYTCHVKNAAGENNYTYEVLVHTPPIFENTTLNQTIVKVISGTNFTTEWRVGGYPPPDVCIHTFKLPSVLSEA